MESAEPNKPISRLAKELQAQAASFFNKYANRQTLLTITGVEITTGRNKAIIYLSVLPSEKSKAALDFANRHRRDFREELKGKIRGKKLPQIHFALDNSPKIEL